MPINNKSLCWAYLCLFLGGFFGLHQLYLGRFRHAFVLWISFGGCFGLGLLYELWMMPEYVAETNCNHDYVERLVYRMRKHSRGPPFGLVRYVASVVVADILGSLVQGAIPHEWFGDDARNSVSRALATILVPFACAIGVHLVGNIGRYQGRIVWPLLAAYLTAPFYWFNINAVFLTSVLSVMAFVFNSLEWRRTIYIDRPIRYLVLVFGIIFYLSLWTSWFYFNCTMVKQNETIKCRTAAKNFFNSPAWLEFWAVMQNLARYIWNRGLTDLWEEIIEALDPQGEQNALKTLNLTENATQEEITAAYRKLARQWHPDKRSGADKTETQERFMAIQEAYDLLSQIKQQRRKKIAN